MSDVLFGEVMFVPLPAETMDDDGEMQSLASKLELSMVALVLKHRGEVTPPEWLPSFSVL